VAVWRAEIADAGIQEVRVESRSSARGGRRAALAGVKRLPAGREVTWPDTTIAYRAR
jgi:hypothetical protein